MRHNLIALIAQLQVKEGRLIPATELARMSGISYEVWRHWLETPNPTRVGTGTVAAFCRFFECSIDELLIMDDEGGTDTDSDDPSSTSACA